MTRILLKTPLSLISGYGNDGMGLAEVLTKEGFDVTLRPTALDVPVTPVVAGLLTKPIEGPYDLLLHHDESTKLWLSPAEMRISDLKVAWSMYERPSFTYDSFVYENLELTKKLDSYDAFFGYDDVSIAAFKEVMPPDVVVKKLQGGYNSAVWKSSVSRDWSAPIRFCMVGNLSFRKNPFAVIRAFDSLKNNFPDFDAELWLKTQQNIFHPKMEERYPGLKIFTESWNAKKLKSFYEACHAYVGPSRGEGKNLPAVEASTTGCVPLVSDYAGHREWADPSWAYMLPGAVSKGWFEVDEAALALAMLDVHRNRPQSARKGQLAATLLPTQLDWSKVVARLMDMLKDVKPRRPIQRM